MFCITSILGTFKPFFISNFFYHSTEYHKVQIIQDLRYDEVDDDSGSVVLPNFDHNIGQPDDSQSLSECKHDLQIKIQNYLKTCTKDQNDFLINFYHKLRSRKQFLIMLEGAAGTGKTFCLNIVQFLLKLEGCSAKFLSPTGAAAKAVGGNTLHQFFSWNISDNVVNKGIISRKTQDKLKQKLKGCTLLIIDEMSRMSSSDLQLVDESLRVINKEQPFGGFSILLTGDLLQ